MALLFADPVFLEHDTGNHPEAADRLQAVGARLDAGGLRGRFAAGGLRTATREELERVHAADHIDQVSAFADDGGGRLDPDTVVSRRSYDVARHAAGAAVAAVEAVLDGPHRRAACLVRPPRHHALPDRAMGFCLFNNVAVAARHAQHARGLSRILIVDWDVHHGNGTQAVFEECAHVYYFSAHRWPFYPGTGLAEETGTGAGLGTIFNLPMQYGIPRSEYLERFRNVLEQAADRCRPELVLVSAGFDAHHADPIGSLGLESEDFAALTGLVLDVADEYSEGRLVSLLEGGYNVQALAESVEQHLEVLLRGETQ